MLLAADGTLLKPRDLKGFKPYGLAIKHNNATLASFLREQHSAKRRSVLLPVLRVLSFVVGMVLYGILFPVFVTVGYLRRRRIARLLGKIPQTFFRLLSPLKQQHKFDKETKKGLSENALFLFALPLVMGLWLYPFFVLLVAIPNMDSAHSGWDTEKREQDIMYYVGLFYAVFAIFLALSTLKCFYEKELLHVRHPRTHVRLGVDPSDVRLSVTRASLNVLRIFICVFDFVAFARFGIPDDLAALTPQATDGATSAGGEYEFLKAWQDFGGTFLLDLKQNAFIYAFWLGVLAITAWFMLSTYLGSSMVVLQSRKLSKFFNFVQPDFFSKIPGLSSLVPILAVAAVLPVSSIFFRALDCVAVPGEDQAAIQSGVLFFRQRGVNMTELAIPDPLPPHFVLTEHCESRSIPCASFLPEAWQGCAQDTYTAPCVTDYVGGTSPSLYGCCAAAECTRGYASCLESHRSIECWRGEHVFYALTGLTYLLYYLPSCVVIGIYFTEPDEDVSDIRFSGAYMMLEIALKWLMSLLYIFFNETPIVTQIGW